MRKTSALLLTLLFCTLFAFPREEDSLALVKIMEVNPNHTLSWDTSVPFDTWEGIEMQGDLFFKIDIAEKGLDSLPPALGLISEADGFSLDISKNSISFIPESFNELDIHTYKILENYLQFPDLEILSRYRRENYMSAIWEWQKPLPIKPDTIVSDGQLLKVEIPNLRGDNKYEWKKYSLVSGYEEIYCFDSILSIFVEKADSGCYYYCEITSDQFPDAIINTTTLHTSIVNAEEKTIVDDSLALIALMDMNPGKLPWDISQKINSWQGVSISNNRVSGLNFDGLDLEYPGSLSDLDAVKSLSCQNVDMSDSISLNLLKLRSLEYVNLSNSSVSFLPIEITSLRNLKELIVEDNNITSIPNSFGEQTGLTKIVLSNNENLKSLPEAIGLLPNLSSLKFDGTGVDSIPQSFSALTDLTELSLPSKTLGFNDLEVLQGVKHLIHGENGEPEYEVFQNPWDYMAISNYEYFDEELDSLIPDSTIWISWDSTKDANQPDTFIFDQAALIYRIKEISYYFDLWPAHVKNTWYEDADTGLVELTKSSYLKVDETWSVGKLKKVFCHNVDTIVPAFSNSRPFFIYVNVAPHGNGEKLYLKDYIQDTTISLYDYIEDIDDDTFYIDSLNCSYYNDDDKSVESFVSYTHVGDSLTLAPQNGKSGTIHVRANVTSPSNSKFYAYFIVEVSKNTKPVVKATIHAQIADEDFGLDTININEYIEDPDNAPYTVPLDTLHYVASVSGVDIGVTIVDSLLIFTSKENVNGVGVVEIKAFDKFDSCSTTFDITVTAVNDAPFLKKPFEDLVLQEDFGLDTINLNEYFGDPDNAFADEPVDILEFRAYRDSKLGILPEIKDSLLILRSVSNRNDSGCIKLKALDLTDTCEAGININLTPVNDTPQIISIKPISTLEESILLISTIFKSVESKSPDKETLSNILYPGENYVIDDGDTTVTFAENFNGIAKIPVQVADLQDSSVIDTVLVDVTPVYDKPTLQCQFADTAFNIRDENSFGYWLQGIDPQDVDPKVVMSIKPYVYSFVMMSPEGLHTAHLSLDKNDVGEYLIEFASYDKLADGDTLIRLDTVTFSVYNGNSVPVVTRLLDTVKVKEDTKYTLSSNVTITDGDNDPVTVTWNAIAGTSLVGDTITFAENFNGILSVPYTATDGYDTTLIDSFVIDVLPVNDAPFATVDSIEGQYSFVDSIFSLDVGSLFDDVDSGESLKLSVSSPDISPFDWYSVNAAGVLQGISQHQGEWQVIVTAQDDSGATVALPFNLIVDVETKSVKGGKISFSKSLIASSNLIDLNREESIDFFYRAEGPLVGEFSLQVFSSIGDEVYTYSGDVSDEKLHSWNLRSKYGYLLASGKYLVVLKGRDQSASPVVEIIQIGIKK